jgi:hypothetical protein
MGRWMQMSHLGRGREQTFVCRAFFSKNLKTQGKQKLAFFIKSKFY